MSIIRVPCALLISAFVLSAVHGFVAVGSTAENTVAAAATVKPPTTTEVTELIDGAQRWLLAQQQDNGAFLPGAQFTLGITALMVHVLCSPPVSLPGNDPPEPSSATRR